jgi:hypothetical protein
MKFEEVLPLLREGKKFRRLSWSNYDDKHICVYKNKIIFCFIDFECDLEKFNLDSEDILADDWEIVE